MNDRQQCAARWMWLAGLMVAVAMGCKRDDTLVKQDDPSSTAPDITLDPWSIDFGKVPLGESTTLPVTIINRGNATLYVERASPEGTGAFTVPNVMLPLEVPAGGEQVVDIVYTAAGVDVGSIEFGSTDPDSPAVSLALSGEAAFPQLDTNPGSLQMGRVVRCGEAIDEVELINVGEADLTVTELSVVGAGWSLSESDALPLTLAPAASSPVLVRFSPLEDGDAIGSLFVTSNDPRTLVEVPLGARGEGYAVDERAETHIQPGGPYDGVDIVFFIDQSASMDDERQLLGDRFGELVDELNALGLSWQAGVVSDDDGCTNTGIIRDSHADAVTRFQEGLIGDWGWFAESGLTVASQALQAASPGGCNEGLLREDALPLVVAVADEADQSEGGWLPHVYDMTEAAPGVIVNAVVGPVPDGCETAEPGTGYADAVRWSGGVSDSVCDPDWVNLFEDLGGLAAGEPTDTFPLEAPPEDGSLVVLVDGVPTTDGWTYEPDLQAVVFDEMPAGGTIIDLQYIISSECE